MMTVQKMRPFTHRKHGDEGQGKLSQLDDIIGPKGRHDDCYIFEGKLWNVWNNYPIYARISGRKRQ